ncbi:MAG: hypothetical protein JXQ72_07210, partial [Anaerolineae bacterium]|nr:hypothetical protein [Anaerolineae bacterium]
MIVGLVVIVYVAVSLSISADPLLMPLDDTYIHFQYARQFAGGDPFVYYDGDPATSGGTSLLYPPLLAVGYMLGFTGWSLAYWALALGTLCFFGAVWLVYLIGRSWDRSADYPVYALSMAAAFAVSGPFIWAALSGMETALFLFAALLTLYMLQQNRRCRAVGAAFFMTLIRPEGLILAGISMAALALRVSWPQDRRGRFRWGGWLVVPLLAGLVQPGINVLATGSASSSGMQAKSHLYNTSVPVSDRLLDSLEFFGRMWLQLLTGHNPDFGQYTPWLLVVMAFGALGVGIVRAWKRREVTISLVMLAWMLALTASVATLDTAFWQFKRYQLPVMALFFPAVAWGLGLWGEKFTGWRWERGLRWLFPALILISSLITGIAFARNYAENVRIVRDQQVPMARWVKANIPKGARVGVHDVGLMGYFSDHPLYDVVGLTLPGPAESWRQGPGAIYEHMAHSDYRPDYFAIYPDVQGLTYLRDAGILGEVLAEFPVDLGDYNVASAADYQAVYRADWSTTREEESAAQTTTLDYLAQIEGLVLVDQVDVANLDSEAAHDYDWWQDKQPPGFVTEVYTLDTYACGLEDRAACRAADGGRVLTGGEAFTIQTTPGQDVLLVTRLHGRASVSLDVYANGKLVAHRIQPDLPGHWLDVVTLVPGERITGHTTRIRIEVDANGTYRSYYHWVYQGAFIPVEAGDPVPVAALGAAGQVRLLDYEIIPSADQIEVGLTWAGPAPESGDGFVFVHLYHYDQVNVEPVAQVVARPMGGVLPPGNWLPGVLYDRYTVLLPEDLLPGRYVVAVGMFDAGTGQRYAIQSG